MRETKKKAEVMVDCICSGIGHNSAEQLKAVRTLIHRCMHESNVEQNSFKKHSRTRGEKRSSKISDIC